MDAWAAARVAHARRWNALLPPDSPRLARLFPTWPDGAVPYAFPVLVAARDAVRVALLRRGIQTRTSWDRLVAPGAGARAIADRILLLPVHQDLDAGDVERTAAALLEAVHA